MSSSRLRGDGMRDVIMLLALGVPSVCLIWQAFLRWIDKDGVYEASDTTEEA